MSTGTGEQAFGIYRVTVCIFYPQAEGDSDNGQWIALTRECLMLQQTHQEGDKWLFRMEAFSADNVLVCAKGGRGGWGTCKGHRNTMTWPGP